MPNIILLVNSFQKPYLSVGKSDFSWWRLLDSICIFAFGKNRGSAPSSRCASARSATVLPSWARCLACTGGILPCLPPCRKRIWRKCSGDCVLCRTLTRIAMIIPGLSCRTISAHCGAFLPRNNRKKAIPTGMAFFLVRIRLFILS